MEILDSEKRRARNLIWNAAGDYSFEPDFKAYDEGGRADLYWNSIISAARKNFGEEVLSPLLGSFAGCVDQALYEELAWIAIENTVFPRESASRPALPALRKSYARRVVALSANGPTDRLMDVLTEAHFRRALGENPALKPRDRELLDALEAPRDMDGPALSAYILDFLRHYFGFVPQEKEETTRQIVSSGQGMEPFEKRMANASYLAEGARPYEALEEYDAILASLPSPERRMRTRILCEEGRIYAQLFRFRAAASCYEKAYQLTGSSEIYLNYLAATRLGLSDSEYISFVSEHPESVNASLELEKRMDSLIAGFNASERKLAIDSLKRYQSEGQDASYEVALHQTLQKLKEEYRSSLAAPVA